MTTDPTLAAPHGWHHHTNDANLSLSAAGHAIPGADADQPHDVAVCIGRFQGLHLGQLAIIRRALALAPQVVVVIGSAFQARTPKNPFTWQERAEMIRLALAETVGNDASATTALLERVQFRPVRDYFDTRRWVGAVHEAVDGAIAALQPPEAGGQPLPSRIVLVGHRKDATSEYLDDFPGWTLDAMASQGNLHSSNLRDAYFATGGPTTELPGNTLLLTAALGALVSQAPQSTLAFLRTWAELPYYRELAAEWAMLREEKAQWASAPYPPVFVTVDSLVQCNDHVLLVVRGRAPGKGLYALPGGFLEQRETVYQSALRELREETGLHLLPGDMAHALQGVKVFDHPDRSPRGRIVTHAHHFNLGHRHELPEVAGADDAAAARWVPISELAGMEDRFHDDHFHILDSFLGLT